MPHQTAKLAWILAILIGNGCVSRSGTEPSSVPQDDARSSTGDGGDRGGEGTGGGGDSSLPLALSLDDSGGTLFARGESFVLGLRIRVGGPGRLDSLEGSFSGQPDDAIVLRSLTPLPSLDQGGLVLASVAVDVSAAALVGTTTMTVTVAGRVSGLSESASASVELEITGGAALIVTTLEDEDDIGAAIPNTDAAGGLADLSLREALRIANVLDEPPNIRFDPAVFPLTGASIALTETLPTVLRNGATVAGPGVVLDATTITAGPALAVEASDVSLVGIELRNHTVTGRYALEHRLGDRLTLDGVTFRRCGVDESEGAQALLAGGSGHVVRDAQFLEGDRDGLRIVTPGVDVTSSLFDGTGDDGVTIEASNIRVTDCEVRSVGSAVQLSAPAVQNVELRRNQFVSLAGTRPGVVFFSGTATNVLIGQNAFEGFEPSVAINVDTLVSELTLEQNELVGAPALSVEDTRSGPIVLRDNVFADESWDPIALGGANDGMLPPSITSSTGDTVSGTSAAGGLITVYEAGPAGWVPVGEGTANANGVFSFALDRPTRRAVAYVTTASGSSEFSTRVGVELPLTITTLDDELDGPETMTTLAEAGGAGDLSLREALILANNLAGPERITLDASLQPGTVTVGTGDAGEVLLPAVTDHDLIVDGAGALTINSTGIAWPDDSRLFALTGRSGVLTGVRVGPFSGASADCIVLSGENNRLDAIEVTGCQDKGIEIDDAVSATVQDATTQGGSNGVLVRQSENSVILRVTARGANDDCFAFSNSSGVALFDSRAELCGDDGVDVARSTGTVIVGNQIFNPTGDGILARDGGAIIAFNTLAGGATGIVTAGTETTQVQNNIVAHHAVAGISSVSTVTLIEEHNLFFDNAFDGITGAQALVIDGAAAAISPTSLLADPQLADLAGGDLTPATVVVDAGLDIGFDRAPMVSENFVGAAPDIGHLER